jgi:hypothetical protein
LAERALRKSNNGFDGDLMQRRWTVIAALGIVLTCAGASAQEAPAASQMRVLSERSDRPAPTVLRGTPATPRAASAAAADGERWQIVAGKRLWLIDSASGEVRSCRDRDTTTVGRREIRCTSGELGRYGRTFGPNYRH